MTTKTPEIAPCEQPAGTSARPLRAVVEGLASPPLAAIGAWVALILVLHPVAVRFLTPATEDILRFLLLGLAIPAIGLWWASRWPRSGWIGQPAVAAVLSVVAVVASGIAVARHGWGPLVAAVALAAVQTALLAGFGQGRSWRSALLAPGLLAAGFAGVAGWAVALAAFPSAMGRVGGTAPPIAAAIAAPLLLALGCWWGSGASDRHDPRAASLAIDAIAAASIVVLSVRTTSLFVSPGFEEAPLAHHHWSFVVGPAMLVRDGGWLLWDTPAPYGFLGTLTLAAMPVASVWQAAWIFTAFFTPLMFGAVYLVMRGVRRGILSQVFAVLVTIGLFFTIMDQNGLYGRHFFPSAGPFRFLWALTLLGLLAVERRTPAGSSSQRTILLLGTAAWIIGILWSVESAFYCSAVWLPGFLIVILRDRCGGSDARAAASPRRLPGAMPRLLGWLMLPGVALAATVAALCVYYLARLGHLPDFRAYADYVLAYNGAAIAQRMHWPERAPLDGLYLPAIAIIAASFALIAVIIRRVGWTRDSGLLIGATWSTWAWSSYILARKDPISIYMALPVAAIAISLLLRWLMRHPDVAPASLGPAYRAVVLPALVLTALAFVGRPTLIANTVEALRQPSSWRMADIDAGLPDLDPELAALLAGAGAAPGDPVLAVTRPFSVIETAPPASAGAPRMVTSLTPALPAGLMGVLAPERRQAYMQRWADRHPRAGWVIQRKQGRQVDYQYLEDTDPWFWEQLFRTHVPTRAWASEHWDLLWVEPAPPGIARPALANGRWMFDPSLIAVSVPGVWASWSDPFATGRKASGEVIPDGATLDLHSDAPRTMRLSMDGNGHRGYDLALDGVLAGTIDPKSRNRNAVDLALPAGWSRLVVTPAVPGDAAADAATVSRITGVRIEPLEAAAGPDAASAGATAAASGTDAPGARVVPVRRTPERTARPGAEPSPVVAQDPPSRSRRRDREATPAP